MHHHYMKQAIDLSEQARFISPPNPWVGCVIVKDHHIVGRGFTQPPGQSHAEIGAIHQAQDHAKGATLYVTLEPCCHFGRTPPCTDAIIRAGIRSVYLAQLDPDSRVRGKGVDLLRKAGLEVHVGTCEKEAHQALAPYLYHRQKGIPYTVIKTAISLDGRTAAPDGTSQWITSEEARHDVHRLRAESQAIIIGSGTALKDLPKLTVRHESISLTNQPLRVLLDTNGRVPAVGPLFDKTLAPTLIFTSQNCSPTRRQEWEKAGAEVLIIPASKKLCLTSAWEVLGQRHILQALVEGGATLQSALMQAGCFDKLCVYVGSLLLGSEGLPCFTGSIRSLSEALRLTLNGSKQLGNTIRLDYEKENS